MAMNINALSQGVPGDDHTPGRPEHSEYKSIKDTQGNTEKIGNTDNIQLVKDSQKAKEESNKAIENIDQKGLQKLSVIMDNFDRLPPNEQAEFSKTLEGVQKEVGDVFTSLLKNKSGIEQSTNNNSVEKINKDEPSSTVELIKDKEQASSAARSAMEYINKNPQVLSQLAVAIENFNKLSPEQQKAVSNAFKEIQGEVDRVYTIIQQNSVEKNE